MRVASLEAAGGGCQWRAWRARVETAQLRTHGAECMESRRRRHAKTRPTRMPAPRGPRCRCQESRAAAPRRRAGRRSAPRRAAAATVHVRTQEAIQVYESLRRGGQPRGALGRRASARSRDKRRSGGPARLSRHRPGARSRQRTALPGRASGWRMTRRVGVMVQHVRHAQHAKSSGARCRQAQAQGTQQPCGLLLHLHSTAPYCALLRLAVTHHDARLCSGAVTRQSIHARHAKVAHMAHVAGPLPHATPHMPRVWRRAAGPPSAASGTAARPASRASPRLTRLLYE